MANLKLVAFLMLFALVGICQAQRMTLKADAIQALTPKLSITKRATDQVSSGTTVPLPGSSSSSSTSLVDVPLSIANMVREIASIIQNIVSLTDLDSIPGKLQGILSSVKTLLNTVSIGNLIEILISNVDTLKLIPGLGSIITVIQTVMGVIKKVFSFAQKLV